MKLVRSSALNRWSFGRRLGLASWAATLLAAGPAVGAAGSAPADAPLRATGESLEEIVVTARKRVESLQDAPISISAFSGSDLESRGADDLIAVAQFTPNLTVQNNPGNGASTSAAAVYLRGVGQDDFAPTLEPGVGIYVDGVYVARTVGALLDILDIDRLEVLRGPQGTLFGPQHHRRRHQRHDEKAGAAVRRFRRGYRGYRRPVERQGGAQRAADRTGRRPDFGRIFQPERLCQAPGGRQGAR